jgi:DNA mismatch endonuclease (patch repair protein)
MRMVRSRDTTPEMVVRRLVHALGFRYRLHGAKLPGKPDLVFSTPQKIIFVHGCFWHGHLCPRGNRAPKTNVAYWRAKIQRNVARDKEHLRALRREGWRVLVIWECQTRDTLRLKARLRRFLAKVEHDA